MRNKVYNLNSVLDFGQYKEETIKEVFEKNLSYILWCIEKIDYFYVDDDIYEKIMNLCSLPFSEFSEIIGIQFVFPDEERINKYIENIKIFLEKKRGKNIEETNIYYKSWNDEYDDYGEDCYRLSEWEADTLDAFEGDWDLYNTWLNEWKETN